MTARKDKAHATAAPAITLEGLQSRSEKLGEWISANPVPILGTMGALLLVAAVLGFVGSSQSRAASEAAAALASAQSDYRSAMGAKPGDATVPEPANPETARRVRTQFVGRFAALIDEHAGTAAAAFAALEKGTLEHELGDPEAALATWTRAAEKARGAVRGILLARIAAAQEATGKPAEAAASYEAAAAVPEYALRHRALADAARCRAQAGENESAAALLQRLEAEAPDYVVPAHIAAHLAEVRAALQAD